MEDCALDFGDAKLNKTVSDGKEVIKYSLVEERRLTNHFHVLKNHFLFKNESYNHNKAGCEYDVQVQRKGEAM